MTPREIAYWTALSNVCRQTPSVSRSVSSHSTNPEVGQLPGALLGDLARALRVATATHLALKLLKEEAEPE